MRQPDIEIYLKDADHNAITQWLSKALGPCSEWRQQGQTYKCSVSTAEGSIPVTWLPKAVGKWNSLFLESDITPWDDDLASFAALSVEVRCAPGGWSEEEAEEQADRWIRISSDGEEEITWHTS